MATVLIVDDEPDIVLFARVNLELSGYQVLSASDGVEALAAVHEHRPDVVLLDVMMPHLDGWSVLERLKADDDEAIRTIPVVMLTALTSDHDQARGGIEGAVTYLAKPVTPDAMVAAVGRVLEGDSEPVQRKAAQRRALERLARMERGGGGASPVSGPRPHLGRLERAPSSSAAPSADRAVAPEPVAAATALTENQRALLRALQSAPSVSDAARVLDMSRSNIYASLRRVGRKLGQQDVSELLRLLRAGRLDAAIEE
jgi:CheY-like chemotaxis protein